VAPHKDICPQGSTYPKKAVAIIIKKIKIPEYHNAIFLYDRKYKALPMWVYTTIKNIEAPPLCM